jgi:hypothetical protein
MHNRHRRSQLRFAMVSIICGFVVSLAPAGESDWKEFAPKDGGFSVKFPGATKSGKAGTEGDQFSTERVIVNQVAYTLYWKFREKPFANATAADVYMRGQQQGVANAGKLTSEKEITVEGFKGREFSVEAKGSVFLCRVLVVDRLVVTQVIQGATPEIVKSEHAKRFFDSFKLVRDKK